MFPREVYRRTWERLSARLSEREAQLATELEQLIELDPLPGLLALTTLLAPHPRCCRT